MSIDELPQLGRLSLEGPPEYNNPAPYIKKTNRNCSSPLQISSDTKQVKTNQATIEESKEEAKDSR